MENDKKTLKENGYSAKRKELFKINELRDFQIILFKGFTFIFLIVLATYIVFNAINN
jgi:hypothetical protein